MYGDGMIPFEEGVQRVHMFISNATSNFIYAETKQKILSPKNLSSSGIKLMS